MTQPAMVRVKALRCFTKTTEEGQFHGDPNSHLEEGRFPTVPASVVAQLVDRGCVEVLEGDGPAPSPALPQLDHDGDGAPGGSTAPEPTVDLAELRKIYREVVGKAPFPGWGADELSRRIDAASEDSAP